MEEIIQGWNSELDARAQAFARHAQALQEWDRAILARRHALLAVEEDVIKVSLLALRLMYDHLLGGLQMQCLHMPATQIARPRPRQQ